MFDYEAHHNDELSFRAGDRLVVLRKGDDSEREWWWSRLDDKEGYVPRNLLGVRIQNHYKILILFEKFESIINKNYSKRND